MPIKPTNYLSLDLEINEGSIVQVGVCIGNVYDSEEDYLTLSWYVKPTNDLPITPFISWLLGSETPAFRPVFTSKARSPQPCEK